MKDIMALQYIAQHPDKNGVGLFDNCAVRNNGILNSAGIATRGIPFPGEFSRDVQSIPGAKTFIIPQNGAIPQGLLDVLPSFQSSPVEYIYQSNRLHNYHNSLSLYDNVLLYFI